MDVRIIDMYAVICRAHTYTYIRIGAYMRVIRECTLEIRTDHECRRNTKKSRSNHARSKTDTKMGDHFIAGRDALPQEHS